MRHLVLERGKLLEHGQDATERRLNADRKWQCIATASTCAWRVLRLGEQWPRRVDPGATGTIHLGVAEGIAPGIEFVSNRGWFSRLRGK